MIRRLLVATLLPLVATATHAQDPAVASRIDPIATAALDDGPIAGLSIAVMRNGRPLVNTGYGYADIENDVLANDRTVYRIGSLTKQFTSAAIMRLVEQGKIGLQDDLTTHLPDYPTQGNVVTIEHLLTHTSGIKSYTGLGEKWRKTIRLDLSHDELLDLFKNEPFDFAPGEQYLYNNSGYYLLGVIIERLTGQPYADHIREEFFEPLGMMDSYYCTNRAIIKHRAEGYARDGDELVNDGYLSMNQPYAAGSLCSNTSDLATWTLALNEGRVVSAESYAQMTMPMMLNNGEATSYGYGLGVGELQEHPVISHGGGINGFNTYLGYYPEDDLTVVVLANTEGANPGRIARDIVRTVLDLATPPVAEVSLSEGDAERYVGVYDLGGLTLDVELTDNGLMVTIPGQPPGRLLFQGEHRFLVAEDTEIELLFDLPESGLAGSVVVKQGGAAVANGERVVAN